MIKVLSLFDGIAGARQALKELNIDCDYGASEIDKFAIQIAKKNHEDIIYLGDVREIYFPDIECLDLLIGGSPCQDLSIAGKGKGLSGERSGLFFKYLEAKETCRPKHFVFENVASMKAADRDFITEKLGVQPVMINSNLLTAQNRKRLYWVSAKIEQPQDQEIFLENIIESGSVDRKKSYGLDASYFKGTSPDIYFNRKRRQAVFEGDLLRKLTPTECEKLQGFPDNYTAGISNTQRYKALGNSFRNCRDA